MSRVIMPTYSYRCDKCGKRFTRAERIAAHGRGRVACPKCKSKAVSQEFRSFFAKTTKKS
jgi:putative FmdB family regulatory protein